ncbi:class I SAM-dependent methyltransferase [Brachybacterium sp.]|jgi:SAM-dependent methyltransferase|uniref:class I SAM-dependent methyltransferase n=1 Tax=Brachybacterium sp. TaxID=1891286 RepID=UPI002ED20BEE
MQSRSADRDFSTYNAAQAGRAVRPLAVAGVEAACGPVEPPRTVARGGPATRACIAVDLGCGLGIEARHLAENGYEVHAYDADPSVSEALEALAAELPVHPRHVDLAEIRALPDADLILACASMPFIRRDAFDRLWRAVLGALRPQGILAVDLFGERDDWAGTEGTYLSRDEVESLLDGLEVLELTEEEREGRSFSGPKHWHTFRVLARRP